MHDHLDPPDAIGPDAEPAFNVDLGPPLAGPPAMSPATSSTTPPMAGETRLAAGLQFVGNALLAGPCTVAGEVEGHLRTAAGHQVAIVVTESGRVRGDITAQQISVRGSTEGLLDAGAGEVTLHDSARVQGVVRYGRIRVDGADLNATLERVPPRG